MRLKPSINARLIVTVDCITHCHVQLPVLRRQIRISSSFCIVGHDEDRELGHVGAKRTNKLSSWRLKRIALEELGHGVGRLLRLLHRCCVTCR